LIKQLWKVNQYESTTEFNQKDEHYKAKNLYNLRGGKKHALSSLRSIVTYDTNLFTTFFPIVLTTPTVCSHLFQDIRGYFDIVLLDEASQLRIEDTLPVLLKGKQCIIAGDRHQMPPSRSFKKIALDTFDKPTNVEKSNGKYLKEDLLLKSESLLDFAEEMGFDEKYLDFHYRSQHPFLIDFSNHAFYEKRLVPQPTKEQYKPIVFFHLKDSIYTNNVNEAEADLVVSILENNIHSFPDGTYPTVGIATFNEKQQNLIYQKINELKNNTTSSELSNKIEVFETNPKGELFVKNLERLQGDERDVLIITTTFGKNEKGNFSKNFGLLNWDTGYRRLNVLITRAKCKIYVCTSIPEKDILNYQASLKEYGNNKRAILFTYLAYAKAISENDEKSRLYILDILLGLNQANNKFQIEDSTFKQEVYQRLHKKYGADKIKINKPFAGYNLDIVFDSINKIVIECDGTINHDSEEAYLFDYHRKVNLEKHGYIFYRIWSTRWWMDAEQEFKKLCRFIEDAGKNRVEVEFPIRMKLAFTDEIKVSEKQEL